ncbi:hypothetical protein K470DRAFT_267645 [Piedraia hortae CBS 480.64]|uniref:Uncharacterized protein n=1 Tax=Piedraia hortae CBS 480.64 TaxID=1314780 RepID=A0A6A7CAQ6_9PEZI|nr:hypothetical protein K470DRAFT_267645 [Piedraia hortae CBS 480.64]
MNETHGEDVASKVLRRVQVSKIARTLQDRLALANVKMQNGWENMSLEAIEPQIKRKRPNSSNEASDTASTVSSRFNSSSGIDSSPLTGPMYSDDFVRSCSSPSKRRRLRPAASLPSFDTALGRSTRWTRRQTLVQSSPLSRDRQITMPPASILSFISEAPTAPGSSPSPSESEDDDSDLPLHSFSLANSISSPPRTPSPDRRLRKSQSQSIPWSRTPRGDGDWFTCQTSTPGDDDTERPTRITAQPPSTPPCKPTPLPSSHMTPGTTGAGFLALAPATPGGQVNFAEFVNITPSPAQVPWTRTPTTFRTPARRRLNFDNIIPPPRTCRGTGLGLDLGGELES